MRWRHRYFRVRYREGFWRVERRSLLLWWSEVYYSQSKEEAIRVMQAKYEEVEGYRHREREVVYPVPRQSSDLSGSLAIAPGDDDASS